MCIYYLYDEKQNKTDIFSVTVSKWNMIVYVSSSMKSVCGYDRFTVLIKLHVDLLSFLPFPQRNPPLNFL